MALRLTTLLLICTRIRAFAPARPLATKRSAFAPARPLKRSTRLHAVPSVQKRGGDAMILTALSVWQALLRAPWATDPDAYLTVDFEGAVIRGSRLALCLYIAEKVFKALRAPESVREVPFCVEINQCVACTRQFFTKSFLGDDAAVLARSSGEEPSPRHRAGVASMAW